MGKPSVYTRAGSPRFYVSFVDSTSGRRRHRVSPFRTDHPEGLRRARDWAEKQQGQPPSKTIQEAWGRWVPQFLSLHYSDRPATFAIYSRKWSFLHHWLVDVAAVSCPQELQYEHVIQYHAWRTAPAAGSGRRKCGHNTARDDLTALSMIMNEAIRRGFADRNPCRGARLPKTARRRARELKPDELRLIEDRLPAWIADAPQRRAWMGLAYAIARRQGCRLSETRLELATQVNVARREILFRIKGAKGLPRELPTLMHPDLVPVFEELIAQGRLVTLDLPHAPSVRWRNFFDSIGLRDAWFHCLRATVATELARAGVPISQAMRFMGHATREVHRAYQRLEARDLSACVAAVATTGPSASSAFSDVSFNFDG